MFTGVHDSEIVSYAFRSRTEELVLELAPGTGSATVEFTVVFRGVLAHQFIYPLLPSIVLSLEEVPLRSFFEREASNLREGNRQCGWPGPWFTDVNSAIAHCESEGVRAYELEQSYGMSGWVLARAVDRIEGVF